MKNLFHTIQSRLQQSSRLCNSLIANTPPYYNRLRIHFIPFYTLVAVLMLGSAILVSCSHGNGCSESYQQGLNEGYDQGYEDGYNQARTTYSRMHLDNALQQGLITQQEYNTLIQEDSL